MSNYGEIEAGQVVWYKFKNASKILFIKQKEDAVQPLIANDTCEVTTISFHLLEEMKQDEYDYIVLVDILSICRDTETLFGQIRKGLKNKGILLVVANNRFGVKYFCGDYDHNTKMPFYGINNYPFGKEGEDYDRQGLIDLLVDYHFCHNKFYYPIPDFRLLQVVYTDEMLPKEDFKERVIFNFEHEDALLADERDLYPHIIKNKVFPFFANSFIVECSQEEIEFCDVIYAAVSVDRAKENAFVTAIHSGGKVTKSPIYIEGKNTIEKLRNNMGYLSKRGISVLDAKYNENEIVMDYISAPTLANYLRRLSLRGDREEIVNVFDRLYTIILKSSDHVLAQENVLANIYEEEDWGVILKRTFLELIPMNCFFVNDEFLFYDQEFVYENYPALFPLFRAFRYSYRFIPGMQKVISRQEMCQRFSITESMWNAFEVEEQKMQICIKQREKHKYFYQNIFLDKERMYKRTCLEQYRNREKQFRDFFEEKAEYVLFGTGKCADAFWEKYGGKCKIIKVADNNSAFWKTEKWGHEIESPSSLMELLPEQRKVIICANHLNYIQIAKQLEEMGITEYCQFKK